MNINNVMPDQVVLQEIGERISEHRLQMNLTQRDLAAQAGVSLSTLVRLEDGNGVNMVNLVRILRVLGLLENLEIVLPRPAASPVALLERKGKKRLRASGTRKQSGPPENWVWGDEK